MNNLSNNINIILDNINNYNKNAINEIKKNTYNFLGKYKNDNLLDLIKKASLQGYSGIEWIDLWGVGGLDYITIVQWVKDIIKKQQIDSIIEPYYNNINYRIGICIKRSYIKNNNYIFLPMELRKNIETTTIQLKNNNSLQNKKNIIEDFILNTNIVYFKNEHKK